MSSPDWIAALSGHRPTRRQVSRALSSGGFDVRFVEQAEELASQLALKPPVLIMIDADNVDAALIEASLLHIEASKHRIPVVLLSLGADKGALIELLRKHEIANLIAKHGAIRASHPVLDERELLVTCMKVVQGDIFGIDKYIGGWGIDLRSRSVRSMAEKRAVCDEFEAFLEMLDAPKAVVPSIVTAAEELILNAMVHAPRDAAGTPRYEHIGPVPDLELLPNETVTVSWGCDGQRLMLSVMDNFGALNKNTVLEYISRSFSGEKLVPETKTGGAGLGLSMAFMTIHQLVFNVWDTRRTEALAGWYLRVSNAVEFRGVGKSLNLFWLPAELPADKPQAVRASALAPPAPIPPPPPAPAIARLSGRVDENSDLTALSREATVDLREMTSINSRGLARWVYALKDRKTPLRIVGLPDALVKLASEVEGLLDHCEIVSCAMPWYCEACESDRIIVAPLDKIRFDVGRRCTFCGGELSFAGMPEAYEALAESQGTPAPPSPPSR